MFPGVRDNISRDGTMLVGAGYSHMVLGGCGLETTRGIALFLCAGRCGVTRVSSELAVVEGVMGCKTTSLWVSGLA